MEKLVEIVSENNSVSFFNLDGKSIPEEKVMPLIERKIVDLNLPGKEGILLSAPYSSVLFSSGGSRISNSGAWSMIKEDCTLYLTRTDRGTLVYMFKKEYEELKNRRKLIN
jgi:hypothetical protein